jgi:ATP-dependent exoDNAse (exonuclease V) alpha subunit
MSAAVARRAESPALRKPSRVWTPEQAAAIDSVGRWLRARSPQVFRLFGYAGVGKTTLARHAAASLNGETVFAAYTGKAAMVMRANGCEGATTIHSLIYTTKVDDKGAYTFTVNPNSRAAHADLIVIDECSMVDDAMARDLLSFGTPILVLGDPFQLPPLKGAGFFTEAKPNVLLTQIHRQAADSPIIRLSKTVREGGVIEVGRYGETIVAPSGDIGLREMIAADQVLCGRNATRKDVNRRIRESRGQSDPLPVDGDKLVCLKNNARKRLINGMLGRADDVLGLDQNLVLFTFEGEDGGPATKASVHRAFFEGTDDRLPDVVRAKLYDHFTYGYGLTVHKAQGSQWNHVLVFDESDCFRDQSARWLYTAVTRAADRLTLVK